MDSSRNKPVLVVGSSNHEITITTETLPGPSETAMGEKYSTATGGGAGLAIGLRRLGTSVRFLSRVGDDSYGHQVIASLDQEGIDPSNIKTDPSKPTGLALATVDASGARTAVIAPGANRCLREEHVDDFLRDVPEGSLVVTDLGIPLPTVSHLLQLAKQRGMRTLLHASPTVAFPSSFLQHVDVLVLNHSELQSLCGCPAEHRETAKVAAKQLLAEGVGTVLVLMGTRGVLMVQNKDAWPSCAADGIRFVPAFKHTREDTHGASSGSTSAFVCGLVHHLCDSGDLEDLHAAVRFGLATMAMASIRAEGMASLPTAQEVAAHGVLAQPTAKLLELARRATSIRKRIIRMLIAARSGHPGGSLSVVDVLTTLYFHTMTYNPKEPTWPHRDRLVLSKGHAAPALYSTLIEAGFLDPSLETELRKLGSPLQGHPDLKKCCGIDMSTGSLGQGLSVANGMALAARHNRMDHRVYVILGDGELQEGQVWEAAMSSAHYRLDNVCAVVDYNALQIDGCVANVMSTIAPVADKWRAFGWHVMTVDGHDFTEIRQAFDRAREVHGKPTMIVAHTIKGRGVSFMEGVADYHGATLTDEEAARALQELEVAE